MSDSDSDFFNGKFHLEEDSMEAVGPFELQVNRDCKLSL